MKPFFVEGLTSKYRLFMAVLFCLGLIFLQDQLKPIRPSLNSLISPIHYAAALPSWIFDSLDNNLATRRDLINENEQFRNSQLLISERLQRLAHLEQENQRLRALLDAPSNSDSRRMVAEVLEVEQDPFRHLVLINRGLSDGVYIGQPVLDGKGVAGQVVSLSQGSAQVLLISDPTHALPIRVARNDVRSVAHGAGRTDQLELLHLTMNTDIKVGDRLNTSGLGGRFPEGYPVAVVTHVDKKDGQAFATVYAEPTAALDRIRYLLLMWAESSDSSESTDLVDRNMVHQ